MGGGGGGGREGFLHVGAITKLNNRHHTLYFGIDTAGNHVIRNVYDMCKL